MHENNNNKDNKSYLCYVSNPTYFRIFSTKLSAARKVFKIFLLKFYEFAKNKMKTYTRFGNTVHWIATRLEQIIVNDHSR